MVSDSSLAGWVLSSSESVVSLLSSAVSLGLVSLTEHMGQVLSFVFRVLGRPPQI